MTGLDAEMGMDMSVGGAGREVPRRRRVAKGEAPGRTVGARSKRGAGAAAADADVAADTGGVRKRRAARTEAEGDSAGGGRGGMRGDDVAAATEEGQAAGREGGHATLQAWLRRRQALGTSAQELVHELHVRQGRPLGEVAELLGLPLAGVCELWQARRMEMAAAAPRQEAELTMLREHLAANLWVIVEQTHPRAQVLEEGGVEVVAPLPLPPCPRLLALRLRALDQISKLYGVNLERAEEAGGPPPYAAPPEIAREVRRKVLALHGRDELGVESEGEDGADEAG